MKFKKIVGFGDSWIWGDELMDPALINHPQAHPVIQKILRIEKAIVFWACWVNTTEYLWKTLASTAAACKVVYGLTCGG